MQKTREFQNPSLLPGTTSLDFVLPKENISATFDIPILKIILQSYESDVIFLYLN